MRVLAEQNNEIIKDFEYDLESGRNASWLSFSFRDLIIANPSYKEILFKQFELMPTFAKYHLYHEDRINGGYLSQDELDRWNTKHDRGVFYSDVESKLQDLINEFNQKVSKGLIDKRHYGRNLLQTPIVKILNQIGYRFTEFEKYVSRKDRGVLELYASAFASDVIALANSLNIPSLKTDILNKFINESGNTDLALSAIMANAYHNTDQLRSDYSVLKSYANKLLRDEIQGSKLVVNGDQKFLTNYENLVPLYRLCMSEEMFDGEYLLVDFLNCFDLNSKYQIFPKFRRGAQTKFVYILSSIVKGLDLKKFDKVVLDRFGIKNYYQILATIKMDLVFKNAVHKAIGLK